MNDDHLSDESLCASRLTGADILFLQLVQVLSTKLTGSPTVSDPAACDRIAALHATFREACAMSVEKHLGHQQAMDSLRALESAPLQRYLGARQAMAPALTEGLSKLRQRMGNIEL